MKALKIVLMLTLVVVAASVGVFAIHDITQPIIDDRAKEEAIAAQKVVFPSLVTSDTLVLDETTDFADSGIQEVTVITDESGATKGHIIIAEFSGFSSKIKYIIGVDADQNLTGYQTLSQNDTAGYGAQIADEANWTQFTGMSFEDAGAGNFDGLTGASITTGGWKASFESAYDFYLENYTDVVIPEPVDPLDAYVAEGSTLATYSPTLATAADYGITKVQVINDGTSDTSIVYTVEFLGYENGENVYVVVLDLATNKVLGGYAISSEDTPGIGGNITKDESWVDFPGLSTDDLDAGNIDGISGATAIITTAAWKDSLKDVAAFHKIEFEGAVVAEEHILEDVLPEYTAIEDYTPTEVNLANYAVTKVEVVKDGTKNVAVIYTVEFVGYETAGSNTYIIAFDLETNLVLGGIGIASSDTGGFGKKILDTDEWTEFVNKTTDDLDAGNIDGITGASITTNAWKVSLEDVATFHKAEFIGDPVIKGQSTLYPTADSFVDVTEKDTDNDPSIFRIYDAFNGTTHLGTVYYVSTVGASYSEPTTIQFMVAIDANDKFTGFYMISDTETVGRTDALYVDTYDDSIVGDAIESSNIDDVAGSTLTVDVIQTAIENVVEFHNTKYHVRPSSVDVDNADLLAAYPTASSFESVYTDYPYDAYIGNIYAAKNASGDTIGYVYYRVAIGYTNQVIKFTLGIANDGTTQQLHIWSGFQSWTSAPAYDATTYPQTNFKDSTWLDLFEGYTITQLELDLADDTIDDISGVSTTTGAMIQEIQNVIDYHQDNSVGGGN